MADGDAAFVQKIFHVSMRKWKPDIYHRRQAYDLCVRLAVAKRAAFYHPATLSARPAYLNKFSCDRAPSRVAEPICCITVRSGFFR